MTTDEGKAQGSDKPSPGLISNMPEFSAQASYSDKEQGDGWVVSFLDMMILVLTFFVAFIATQMPSPSILADQQNNESKTEVAQAIGESGAPINGDEGDNAMVATPSLPTSFNQAAEDRRVSIDQSNDGVTLTIDDRFVFPSGSADISPEGIETIERLVPFLKDLPGKIEVYGHTDNVPIRTERFATNWELSAARAVNIVRLLIMQGIEENRLRAVGVAHTQPIASNTTERGRSKNRRVEIQVRKQ
ncbi:OmpA family protein [Marinobacter sp. BW6]|uniref:OmpA/MotB family protein n=1 Tax=Marinobacter sp. BW6 TaxID=2592624 RepID=UPI0011DEABD3|nr:OmpA family protein [Marinobacter sp. BW6]TYC63846.1 OmpA family protein [Marinobacter sp. BW6]